MSKFFCIYKITNLINGKTYVGQHSYINENDPIGKYFGSGILIKKAIKKYGKENFKREILYSRILRQDTANAMEAMMIKKELLKGNCYNCSTTPNGGIQGRRFKNLNRFWEIYTSWWCGKNGYSYSFRKLGESRKGIKRNSETIEKIKKAKKLDPWHPTDEQREKMSNSAKKRGVTSHTSLGKKWFNNGLINVMAEECPKGFVSGMIQKKHWYTDGTNNILIEEGIDIPEGFNPGRTIFRKQLIEVMEIQK